MCLVEHAQPFFECQLVAIVAQSQRVGAIWAMQWAAIGQLSQQPQRAMSHQILLASSVKDGSRRPEPPDRQHGYSERLNPQQWLIHSTDRRIAPELHRRLRSAPVHLLETAIPASHVRGPIVAVPGRAILAARPWSLHALGDSS